MPPKTARTKRSARRQNQDQVEFEPAKRPRTKTRAAVGRKKQATDNGRTLSKQFLDSASKKRGSAHEAKEDIQMKVEQLLEYINEATTSDLSSSLSASSAAKCFAPELTGVVHYAVTDSTSSSKRDDDMHLQCLDHLRFLQDTVKGYEDVSNTNTGVQKPDWMRWEKDNKDLSLLSEAAFAMAARMMNDMIMPTERRQVLQQPKKGHQDAEMMARELLKQAVPGTGESWGKLAQGIVKVCSGIDQLLGSSNKQ